MQLSSKAKTLRKLQGKLKYSRVLEQVCFNTLEFGKYKEKILKKATNFKQEFIVRSSAFSEDGEENSKAGEFTSILHVKPNAKDLKKAINQVIASYKNIEEKDEIFIQPMLKNVKISGVIFTADMDTLSPYYVINYDKSGATDAITSGKIEENKTFICYKEHKKIKHKIFKKLICATKEVEEIFNNNFLDIEFAICKDEIFILQVRSIVKKAKEDLSRVDLKDLLYKTYKKFDKLNAPHPKLLGDESIFGVMPDWNPAEIIGIAPKTLALSLYKELITDEIWAYQRDNYGYRNLRSYPLLVSFMGLSYIDVRVSFNSFIPKQLQESVAKKLVNFYIQKLKNNKFYHDKVEFKIVYSCYYFGIENTLLELLEYGFSKQDIKNIEFSLLELTNNILKKDGIFYKDLQKLEKLKTNFDVVVNSDLSLIDKIYWLGEDCKRYGTLPFAGLARAAFIAVQMLNSFVMKGILTKLELETFLKTLQTVSKKLNHDLHVMKKDEFLSIYGHLRPGTYDITSLRYDEGYSKYFETLPTLNTKTTFEFNDTQKSEIEALLEQYGIKSDFDGLLDFIKKAIEAREYAKFLFTKNLSQMLQYIELLGKRFGFSREDLSYLDFAVIKRLYSTLDTEDLRTIFKTNIENNKKSYQSTKALKLPALITQKDDIYNFFLEKNEPNFVTLKKVFGKIATLDDKDLKDKIVCIKSADPGYDFLFSKDILALVTCYGGVNSHMAIRCAELGKVAVIGCGEVLYKKILDANIVELDASLRRIKIIS